MSYPDHLTNHFVGDLGELTFSYDERKVTMLAYDADMQQTYRLTFDRCLSIHLTYTLDEELEADPTLLINLFDLKDGITEVESKEHEARRFRIDFDQAVVEISCREFTMAPVRGYRWDDQILKFVKKT